MHIHFNYQKKDLSLHPDFRYHQVYLEMEERSVPYNQMLVVSFEHLFYNSVQKSDSEIRNLSHMNSS